MISEELYFRLHNAEHLARFRRQVNRELDRIARKLPPRPDRKDAAHYRQMKAAPELR